MLYYTIILFFSFVTIIRISLFYIFYNAIKFIVVKSTENYI